MSVKCVCTAISYSHDAMRENHNVQRTAMVSSVVNHENWFSHFGIETGT